MNITVKYFLSVTGISIPTLILVRMGITMLGCWAALLVLRERDLFFGPPEYYKILTIRGSAGCIGLFCSYMSFRGLSVSDSITIQFLSPTVTLILGYFVLKESFQKREIAAGLCCLVGTMFVSRPPFLFGDGADGTEVPIDEGGSVIDPSEQGEGPTGSRMVAVGWALTAVFAASVACEYRQLPSSFTTRFLAFLETPSLYWQTHALRVANHLVWDPATASRSLAGLVLMFDEC